MAGVNSTNANAYAYQAYNSAYVNKKESDKKGTDKTGRTETVRTTPEVRDSDYGKTIGEPQLSETAQKYYDKLKQKYGNYDFILVSKDEKANAQANAAKYGNKFKTVVLIDEEKIERMATDESYRKKYEGILSGATAQLEQLKSSLAGKSNVAGFGMQVNDDGTTSLFAVLKKSSADQKARIAKTAEKKKAAKKAEEKKAEKKAKEERIKEKRAEKAEKDTKTPDSKTEKVQEPETVVIKADSLEDLLKKVDEFTFEDLSNHVQTEQEKKVGQSIDYRG